MKNTNSVYIYGLWDPRNYQLRYIGKSVNLKQRLRGHLDDAKYTNNKSYKCNWIRQLLSENLEPSIEILEECTNDNWKEIEQAWIAECKEQGLRLTNMTDGGDGFSCGENHPGWGKLRSTETKTKISDKLKNHFVSKETKQKQSEAKKGKKLSKDHREKLSKAHKGRPPTTLGYKHTKEAREKISKKLSGIKRSDEFKEKIRQSWIVRKQKMKESIKE